MMAYDVSNQRDAKAFSFINLFSSALHVSGDKFAGSISTVALVSSSVGALYQNLYIQSKRAPEDGRNHRPKHVELIGIINKTLLLHLVGCLYYLYQ